MLRGFFLIFLLTGLAIVAVFGFRGQKSTGSPIEVFPDMVRQMKVRAQAPLAFFAVLIMNGLPRWNHPIFNWDRFSRATNDGFFLAIEARDPRFTENETRELLESTGGQNITIVHEE